MTTSHERRPPINPEHWTFPSEITTSGTSRTQTPLVSNCDHLLTDGVHCFRPLVLKRPLNGLHYDLYVRLVCTSPQIQCDVLLASKMKLLISYCMQWILFQDEDVFGRLLGSPSPPPPPPPPPLWFDSRKQQPAESDHLRILGVRSVKDGKVTGKNKVGPMTEPWQNSRFNVNLSSVEIRTLHYLAI